MSVICVIDVINHWISLILVIISMLTFPIKNRIPKSHRSCQKATAEWEAKGSKTIPASTLMDRSLSTGVSLTFFFTYGSKLINIFDF